MLLKFFVYATLILFYAPISIVFANQSVVGVQSQGQCDFKRFFGPHNALALVPDSLPAIKHDISNKIREIENLEREINHHDWSASLTQNIETKNVAAGKFRRTPGALTSISISHPLNIEKIEQQKKLLIKNLDLSNLSLSSLQTENISRKLSLLVDLREAQQLEKILKHRLSIRKQLKNYYSTLRENGQPEIEKELQLTSDVLVLNDQILGNSVNMASILLQLGLSDEPDLPNFFDYLKIPPISDSCTFETFELQILKKQIEIVEIEYEELQRIFDYALDFSINLQTNRVDNQNVSETASASVGLSIPLSDGGRRETQKIGKLAELNGLKTKFSDLNSALNQEYLSYTSKEHLFLASLKSIRNDIAGVKQRISEVNERERLGQTVFLEKSNLKIEETKLAESLLRLTADLYQEWYKFQIDKKPLTNE